MQSVIYRYGYRWVSYTAQLSKKDIPIGCGVYMIRIKKKHKTRWTIIYVGETKCFKNRLYCHPVLNIVREQIKSYSTTDELQVLVHNVDSSNRKYLEGNLIGRFKPMYNYIPKRIRCGKMYRLNKTTRNKYRWLYFFKSYDKIA